MGKNASKRRRRRLDEKNERKAFPRASLSFLRMTARKVRVVADAIRGKDLETAVATLEFVQRAAARPLGKLLRSAAANAEAAGIGDFDQLVVKSVEVDEGPTVRRYLPRAMGRATRVRKKTSHVELVLGRREHGRS
jgi:large subunit ribosomal protein L22